MAVGTTTINTDTAKIETHGPDEVASHSGSDKLDTCDTDDKIFLVKGLLLHDVSV